MGNIASESDVEKGVRVNHADSVGGADAAPTTYIDVNLCTLDPKDAPTLSAQLEQIEFDEKRLFTHDDPRPLLAHYEHTCTVKQECENDFIGAFITAYNHHIMLGLRPDDLAQQIHTTFATYINKFPEESRAALVSHEGKKTIELRAVNMDIDEFCDGFAQQMRADSANPTFCDEMTRTFSTSTRTTRTVANINLMNTLKSYYSCEMILGCGIPAVRLFGTIADWNALRTSYQSLRALYAHSELAPWFIHFDTIIDMFVEMRELSSTETSAQAPPRIVALWERVISYVPQGSGSDTLLGGWVRLFTPYKSSNKLINLTRVDCLDLSIKPPTDKRDYYDWQNKMALYYNAGSWDSIARSLSITPIKIDGERFELVSGFFNPAKLAQQPIVVANMGYLIREDTDAKKERARTKYASLGVKAARGPIEIPWELYLETGDILSAFSKSIYNYYFINKDARRAYYTELGVSTFDAPYTDKNGTMFYYAALRVPKSLQQSEREIEAVFDMNRSSTRFHKYY